MKKIFKKSLAIMVSAAICLTALIGCLSVSAANGEAPVYTVATVEGKKGETVGVNVTGADLTEICGQDLSIIFAKGLTIGTVHDNITNEDLICDPEGDGMQYNVIANDDGTNTVKMVDIINFPEYGEGESYNPALVTGTLDVTISVTIPADAAAGTEYPITIDESQFADYDEEWVRPTLNGGKITVVEDAPSCEHQWEFVSAVPATAEAEGTIQLKCAICEETKAESILYNKFTTVASASASAESEVFMQFDAYTNLFTEGSDIDSVIITIDKENYNAENTLYIMGRDDAVSFESGSYTGLRWKLGLPAKTLNDDVTVYVYCKAGDKWYNGQVLNYSFTTYAKNMLSKETTPAANKAVIMDLVNYGSTAQTLFNYDVDNLANAGFEEYQKYGTPTDVIPEAINEMVTRQDVATDPVLVAQVNLMAEDRVTIRYTLMPKNYSGSADDVKAIISYTNSKGEKITTEYISYDKAVENGLSDKISAGEYFTVVNGNYVLDFSRLAAAEMKTLVTIDVYVNDDLSSSVDYSVQSFVARMRANGTATPEQTACYNAMLRYGDSARIAFSN